jgi:hypothetical protein
VQSPYTQSFRMLYTIVRTLQKKLTQFHPNPRSKKKKKASLWICDLGTSSLQVWYLTILGPVSVVRVNMRIHFSRWKYNLFSSSLLPFGSLLPLLEHRANFSVSWSFTDGRTPWTGDQLVARPLPKHRTTQTQTNAHTHQTSMPWVGFEPTIPASKRAKTVHALDRLVTVTGGSIIRAEF